MGSGCSCSSFPSALEPPLPCVPDAGSHGQPLQIVECDLEGVARDVRANEVPQGVDLHLQSVVSRVDILLRRDVLRVVDCSVVFHRPASLQCDACDDDEDRVGGRGRERDRDFAVGRGRGVLERDVADDLLLGGAVDQDHAEDVAGDGEALARRVAEGLDGLGDGLRDRGLVLDEGVTIAVRLVPVALDVLLGVGGSVGALAVVVCRLAAVAAVGGARSLADGEVVADDGVGRPAPAVRLVLVLAFAQDDVDLVGLRRHGGTAGGLTQPVGTEGRGAGADVGVDDVVHIARELVGRHLAAAVQLGHAAGCALFRRGDRADVSGSGRDRRLVAQILIAAGEGHGLEVAEELQHLAEQDAQLLARGGRLTLGCCLEGDGHVGAVAVRVQLAGVLGMDVVAACERCLGTDGSGAVHLRRGRGCDCALGDVLGRDELAVVLELRELSRHGDPFLACPQVQRQVDAVEIDLAELRVGRRRSERLHDGVLDLILREIQICQDFHGFTSLIEVCSPGKGRAEGQAHGVVVEVVDLPDDHSAGAVDDRDGGPLSEVVGDCPHLRCLRLLVGVVPVVRDAELRRRHVADQLVPVDLRLVAQGFVV